MLEPRLVDAPARLWRVARSSPDPLAFNTTPAEDVSQPRAGNRFDVPGGGILYCATEKSGCYAETLAQFRPTAATRAAVKHEQENFMVCGGVTRDWRDRRLCVEFELQDALPFLDVEAQQTHEFLTDELSSYMASLGISQLDVSTVRGPDRLVTRAISAWAYAATDDLDEPLYSGLKYVSRLGDYECWAIFDGTELQETYRELIQPQCPDLSAVADNFHLRVF